MSDGNISIHPHVHLHGFRLRPPSNTAGRPSKAKLERALAGLEKHSDKHPADGVTKVRITNLKLRIAEFKGR